MTLRCAYCDKPACCTEPVGPLCLGHSDEYESRRGETAQKTTPAWDATEDGQARTVELGHGARRDSDR